ncbi:hypothetical protein YASMINEVIRUS_349 [Yasminevirus sp. GU-2018]|uniref:Uncharacterized protein n=1 Tax=Yasminevirus sp. GU-2018 TaxID=2420051 RepID=A0A5K0U9W2_9VIRU|nr:hypothetical protein YASMINEVIRUS_349 [Yasminevirus sp. GU-2018]
MTEQNVLIRYSIDQIMACRDANALMPRELEEYCVHTEKSQMSILSDLVKPMDDVTKSHSHGINPNDITLRNIIRENLNKLNNKNYDAVLTDIMALNYTSETHFVMLATELIVKSMNDAMASKGFEVSKNGHKTPSELYVDVARKFSDYLTNVEDDKGEREVKQIRFKNIMSKSCQQYFNSLTNSKESMDKNNPHKVSNYKGFMNMIGLMYSNGLFPKEIIFMCFKKIVHLILNSNLSQEECDNYYSGYERLMNRILSHFEKVPITPTMIADFASMREGLKELNDTISKACDDQHPVKPIRMFSIMTHQQNITRYAKLCEIYKNPEKALVQSN